MQSNRMLMTSRAPVDAWNSHATMKRMSKRRQCRPADEALPTDTHGHGRMKMRSVAFVKRRRLSLHCQQVNRCVYNQMVDAAGDPTSRSAPLAKMRVPNCRAVSFGDVKNVHFTICQKASNNCKLSHE